MDSTGLRIRLLGELELRLGERPLPPLGSARAESLLAYLLIHRAAPQPRQRLAFLLWPDSSEPQARTNLRHVLHTLRRALPDADRLLDITPRTLRWRPDAPAWLDVEAFEAALARDDLRAATALYGGDLLAGAYDCHEGRSGRGSGLSSPRRTFGVRENNRSDARRMTCSISASTGAPAARLGAR